MHFPARESVKLSKKFEIAPWEKGKIRGILYEQCLSNSHRKNKTSQACVYVMKEEKERNQPEDIALRRVWIFEFRGTYINIGNFG